MTMSHICRMNLGLALAGVLLAPAALASDVLSEIVPVKSIAATSVLPGKQDR
jgi:hypothetical protein